MPLCMVQNPPYIVLYYFLNHFWGKHEPIAVWPSWLVCQSGHEHEGAFSSQVVMIPRGYNFYLNAITILDSHSRWCLSRQHTSSRVLSRPLRTTCPLLLHWTDVLISALPLIECKCSELLNKSSLLQFYTMWRCFVFFGWVTVSMQLRKRWPGYSGGVVALGSCHWIVSLEAAIGAFPYWYMFI